MSVDPAAETVTDAAFFQELEPPLTVGSVGGVVSSRTVACTQAEAFPAASTAAKRTSVSPWATTSACAPEVAVDQVAPPFVENWKRSWSKPEPPESSDAAAVTLTSGRLSQARPPPATAGAAGAVWSSRTTACDHGETFPTPSTAA